MMRSLRSTVALPLRAAVMIAAFVPLLGACAISVKLVGNYDALLDQSVVQLQSKTNEFYATYEDSTAVPSAESANVFFAGARGSIQAMATRASIIEEGLKAEPLTNNLQELEAQFESARAMDLKKRPLRESSLKALNDAFRALQVQLVFMKKAQSQRPT